MTSGERAAVAAAGIVLVVFGLAFGFVGLIFLSTDNSGDGIWDWYPNYGIGHTLGAVSVALVCGGAAAVVRSVRNPRYLTVITVAIGFLLFSLFFGRGPGIWPGMWAAGPAFVGVAILVGVVIYARVAGSASDSKGEAETQ